MVITGDAAVEEPKEHVVASMDPEAEAGQGKSLGKDKDPAAVFQARCHSIAQTVLSHLEGWPYLLPEGGDPKPVPTHGEERQRLAKVARTKLQTWWTEATEAQQRREAGAASVPR